VEAFETLLLSVSNLFWEAAKVRGAWGCFSRTPAAGNDGSLAPQARLHEKELGKAMVQFTVPDPYKHAIVEVPTESTWGAAGCALRCAWFTGVHAAPKGAPGANCEADGQPAPLSGPGLENRCRGKGLGFSRRAYL
jgi:hypothetical protein